MPKFPKLGNPALLVLAILLAAASYLFFQVLLSGKASSFTSEISAAFLGSLLTIIITAIMLNKQSDVDMRKDRNSQMLEKKITIYKELMEKLGEILGSGNITKGNVVEIQMLNQRLAFIAHEDVVRSFTEFAELFAEYFAKGGKINDAEKDELLNASGKMSVQMRKDLLSREEIADFNETAFTDLIMSNTRSLGTKKISFDDFLGQCSEKDKAYFRDLKKYFDEKHVGLEMGTVGLAIKDGNNKSVVWCFPSSAKRNKRIEILTNKMSEDGVRTVDNYFKEIGLSTPIPEGKKVTFETNELPIERFLELLHRIL